MRQLPCMHSETWFLTGHNLCRGSGGAARLWVALPGTDLPPISDTVPWCRLQPSWCLRMGSHDHQEHSTQQSQKGEHRRAMELTSDVLHLADGQAPLGAVDGLFVFGGGLQEDHVCISQQDSAVGPAVQDVGHLLALQRGMVGVVHVAWESTQLHMQQDKCSMHTAHVQGVCKARAGPEAAHAEAWPTSFMVGAVRDAWISLTAMAGNMVARTLCQAATLFCQ